MNELSGQTTWRGDGWTKLLTTISIVVWHCLSDQISFCPKVNCLVSTWSQFQCHRLQWLVRYSGRFVHRKQSLTFSWRCSSCLEGRPEVRPWGILAQWRRHLWWSWELALCSACSWDVWTWDRQSRSEDPRHGRSVRYWRSDLRRKRKCKDKFLYKMKEQMVVWETIETRQNKADTGPIVAKCY